MTTPTITLGEWRARVEKELAGKPFDKALVHQTFEGIAIAPLYTEAPSSTRALGHGAQFRICMGHDRDAKAADIAADIAGGADALWLPKEAARALPEGGAPGIVLVLDGNDAECTVDGEKSALVSTLAFHDAGADAVDEIALALATCVSRLKSGASHLFVRVAVGRDIFLELCKVRALRLCVRKVLAACGDASGAGLRVHAVCSSRTLAVRDPWVNMLRVTTQTFAAVLGGADFVTPIPFDRALEAPSALGRRVARNTGLVLREESALGRVIDPGAGSYYFETLTDALARKAWARFAEIERDGGVDRVVENGQVAKRIDATWRARRDAVAKRREPILGVSEFANLDEKLPSAPRSNDDASARRDAAPFETLRARADVAPAEALLVTLGPSSEFRPRASFATAFFAAGGVRARETATDEKSPIACLCGTDERYVAEAGPRARALKAAGCTRVVLAGRPGALEAELRAAGVDDFIFMGCDAVAVLDPLLGAATESK